MPYLPDLNETMQTRAATEIFGGYNHNLKINEGEWYDEENISSAFYPLFSQRGRRATYQPNMVNPQGLLAKDALVWVDGSTLYYDGYPIDGIELSTAEEDCPKQMVSMGAYLCVFPDGVYLNTANLTDKGSMAATYKSIENAAIKYIPCRLDGTAYENVTVSDTAPASPENGMLWLDTSSSPHALKQFSQTSGMWVQIPTVYVRIEVTGIGKLFAEGDGVTISGAAYGESGDLHDQINALNTDIIIKGKGDDYIIVVGVLDEAVTQESGALTIERKIPRMSYVCEANNRLWGCYYGMSEGKMLNEIYACKLGDFKNWNCYAGISSDSYRASVGTDGEFTGCIAYLGYPLFFKENCIHKLYGNMPSNYQLQNTTCRGVQRGSAASLAIANEVLYYKSRSDVCAYDGSLPVGISEQFGTELYSRAVGGTHGGKYYISMKDAAGAWHLFVYDTMRGVWHREDGTHALAFTAWGDELFYIDADKNAIVAENGTIGTMEDIISWKAESGMIGYEIIDRQYVSRFNIRMRLGEDAECSMYMMYDSDGKWIYEGTVNGGAMDSFVIPVIPRRCDHFRVKLEGKGDIKIYSIAKIIEQGSDV